MKQPVSRSPVLRVENLSLSYETRRGDVRAVRDVSFEISFGESLGLVGESGCGKSTVALALMGYTAANARVEGGQILFQGENLLGKTERELQALRGNRIAMVYQDPMTTLNPSMRIGDQLAEVLVEHQGLTKSEAYERCVEMLERVQMSDPERLMQRYPHQVSGGQQQRVVIAMALLCNPALLIMDEPTTALDVTVEATVLDLIAALRQEFDSAILYVSHNLGVIARVCDRVGVMYAGELVEEAPVRDIFLNPLHPYTKGLIGCIPRISADKSTAPLCPIPGRIPPPYLLPQGCAFGPRCAFADGGCEESRPPLLVLDGGRSVRCSNWRLVQQSTIHPVEAGLRTLRANQGRAPDILSASKVCVFYGEGSSWLVRLVKKGRERQVKAVDGATVRLSQQAILGVVGESGCGKTSLAKAIAGLVPTKDGQIEFLGVDVSMVVEKRPKKILGKLQMVFQNPDSTLNPTQPVRQIVGRPLQLSGIVPRSGVEEEVRRLLDTVNLDESYLERYPRQLSGGEKQRVAIARAFASRPELVICDEPVSALDVSVQCSVLNTLLDIQESYGTSLVFISHDLSLVRYLCDYVVVMYLGKVVEMGPAEILSGPPYHPYTEALLSAVPVPDPTVQQTRIRLEGPVPSALTPPTGCRFHTRCPRKFGTVCETTEPPPRSPCEGHVMYCHMPLEELSKAKPAICR
jgi:peptide/nickel transport system ATP-binding protein